LDYAKGAEMGRFNMGSTVILLTGEDVQWADDFEAGKIVRMGEKTAQFNAIQ
jgi:phosphatidylserine decarboxylase